MTRFSLVAEQLVPRPLSEVFPFFADARNVQAITPPWLQFEITSPEPFAMAVGLRIDYRLRLHGIPIRWQAEITAWEPPHRFVDEQRRGPYRQFVHEHLFREVDGGTVCEDRVTYSVCGGRLVNRLFVARDLRRVFEYRRGRLARLFGPSPR